MKICFLGSFVSCTRNSFAGSICRHSTLCRTINIMMASTKPHFEENKKKLFYFARQIFCATWRP